ITENAQTVAKHIEPGKQTNLQGKLEQKITPKPVPKVMALPNDPKIRLRPAANNPTINKNLRVSLQSNFMKEVDRWYATGGDINSQDEQGRTLLYLAIQRHHTDGIEFLLLRRADVKKTNTNGDTPLQVAVTTGQSRVVKMLLERHAVITPMPNGDTMIHHALVKGMSVIAMSLLEKGVDVNKTYSAEKSLLHIAATRNLINPAQALLNSGANVNATDSEGATPLHEASARGHARMIRLLLSRKANIKAETTRKWRPIHHAARFGHSGIVSILLSKGASANDRTKGGKTPLSLAKHLHHESVVELLAGRTTVSDTSGSGSSSRSSGWFW
ncbi:MAG: ankyrin repeat domain-containing protein, partial [Thiotrichaceae bacterium]